MLQEPERMVEGSFEMDLNRMFIQGDKLYTFGEDGTVSVYEPPIITTTTTINVFGVEEGTGMDEDGEIEGEGEGEAVGASASAVEEQRESMIMAMIEPNVIVDDDAVASLFPEPEFETIRMEMIISVHTHSFLERGVADGVVSLDGSQIIAIGFDGTFTRIRLM